MSQEPERKPSPWRWLILVPYLGGIGIIVALLTGPVAKLAVSVVVLLVLGAVVWDVIETRRKGSDGATRQEEQEVRPGD